MKCGNESVGAARGRRHNSAASQRGIFTDRLAADRTGTRKSLRLQQVDLEEAPTIGVPAQRLSS